MDHYALRLDHAAIPAPHGLSVIVVRSGEAADRTQGIAHEVRAVIGFQPTTVFHYASDEDRPVHPDPQLMERLGWRFRHAESQYAPISMTPDGRIAALDPDDPRWCLVPPGTGPDRIEAIAMRLKDEEAIRLSIERTIENRDQGNIEND